MWTNATGHHMYGLSDTCCNACQKTGIATCVAKAIHTDQHKTQTIMWDIATLNASSTNANAFNEPLFAELTMYSSELQFMGCVKDTW